MIFQCWPSTVSNAQVRRLTILFTFLWPIFVLLQISCKEIFIYLDKECLWKSSTSESQVFPVINCFALQQNICFVISIHQQDSAVQLLTHAQTTLLYVGNHSSSWKYLCRPISMDGSQPLWKPGLTSSSKLPRELKYCSFVIQESF